MLALRERVPRLGPLARLTLLGALVGLLTAGTVAMWIEAWLDDLMLAQVAARAQDQVQLGILSNIKSSDFELPYSVEQRVDLAARLDPLLGRARQSDSGIIRLNVFARDGTILYSDLASLRGRTVSPLADELLARALAGMSGTEISDLAGEENQDLRQRYGRALEADIPFMLDHRVVGVYEFYEDLAPIQPIRPLVWGSVAAGSGIVFATLMFAIYKTIPRALQAPARPRALAAGALAGEPPRSAGPWLLTRREAEVLRLMADGLTYGQIAAHLVVNKETVRGHAKGVLRKLGQSSRANAVLAARRAGLL